MLKNKYSKIRDKGNIILKRIRKMIDTTYVMIYVKVETMNLLDQHQIAL